MCLCLFLASCAWEELPSAPQVSEDTTTVKLTFCINDGNQTRAITSANENTVSDITVLVFDNTNSLIGSKYVSSVAATSVSVPVTTRSATGCTIYAIANTGSSSYFAGVNTISKLNTMYTTLASADALESSGSTAGSTGALMIGKASANITTGGANQFAIPLYHQCSKFSFTITPASGVTITGYQLCNVPLSSYITDSHVPASASTVVGPPPAGTGSYGNFTAVSGLSQTTALSKTYYVYENLCGSNSNATSEALRNSSNAPTSASYLLVNAKGSNWTSTYRIYLGGVTNVATPLSDLTNFNVYRNLNYQCNITLGASGGNGDARVTYTATTASGRSNMYMGDAPIGNYLYSDGTNGTTFKSGQTVGIIFSSEVTQAQYDAGCRHGRALALKDAYSGSTCAWSNSYSSPYPNQTVHPYCQDFKTCFNDVSSGYDALSANSSYVGSSSNPAWYYCNNYSDGTTHSGSLVGRKWYLPSAGDWWDIMENLCTWTDPQKTTIKGMRTSPNGIGTYMISGLPSGVYYSTFDTKLTTASGTALNHGNYYWCASECDSSGAVLVYFNPSYVIVPCGCKNYGHYVRAVLAF
ncbi:hypothetical protein prwr041_00720 [Prevotella herbatica]|uniref:DUF4906 domain-containing protein n=2 Tax=Prevotella herbatica TaxID=2801997 RepID=A0ABN6EE08_9BACT|nr:hypothetical protein prwr041_00720 [Prevotella herbatica]